MRGRRAFTLMETLLAVAVVCLLAGSVFAFFFDMAETRARIAERVASLRATGAIIERLESDLLACVASDDAGASGVAGDERTLTILGRGVAAGAPGIPGDLQKTEYRFDAPSGVLRLRRTDVATGEVDEGEIGGFTRVRFRYHDGRGWRERFDSGRAGTLPSAIEVAIWLGPAEGDVIATAPDLGEPTEDELLELADPFVPGSEGEPFGAFEEEPEAPRAPDRRRVIAIPDGSGGAWEIGREGA